MLSYYLTLIARFTIHDFRPVGRVRRIKFVVTVPRAMLVGRRVRIDPVLALVSDTLAFTVPQLERVPLSKTLVVTTVWTKTRQRKAHLPVDGKLLWNNFEGSCALMGTLPIVSAANGIL